MIIKWITALSMLWGALCLYDFLRLEFGLGITKNTRASVHTLVAGIPAWAWLIARYLL